MKQFKDFGIKIDETRYVGDKIKVSKILNRPIAIHAFKVTNSKFEGKGECLQMQIAIDDKKHVVFTGGKKLIEVLRQVPKDGFPFTTTIIDNNDQFEFS